jgi:hypothetical protein
VGEQTYRAFISPVDPSYDHPAKSRPTRWLIFMRVLISVLFLAYFFEQAKK